MLDVSRMEMHMGNAHILLLMGTSMLGNGITGDDTVKEKKLIGKVFLKDISMWGNIRMGKGVVKGFILGQMDKSMKGNGKVENFMVKEC
jgi:hypothetical protein